MVFTRFPIAGTTKTRLIPALGPKGAADLQRSMTEHTLARLRRLGSNSIEVRYDGAHRSVMRDWLGQEFVLRSQGEGNLGRRLARAVHDAFLARIARVVVVGTDCPQLKVTHILEALDALREHALVIGPARDGGYYLIGLNRDVPELFQGIEWGTDRVLEQTLVRARELGLESKLLETLDDIDDPEDLPIWKREGEL